MKPQAIFQAETQANFCSIEFPQCKLGLEMADGHFYQHDASRKFFDFATDDPDKVSNLLTKLHYLTSIEAKEYRVTRQVDY